MRKINGPRYTNSWPVAQLVGARILACTSGEVNHLQPRSRKSLTEAWAGTAIALLLRRPRG